MNRLACLSVSVACAAIAWPTAPARACSYAGPSPYVVDPSMQATDQVAPTLPPLSVARLQRGKAMEGCSGNCGEGMGTVAIGDAATDDVTPATGIGYRFSVVAGALPPSFSVLLDQPSRATVSDGKIWFNWDDGATNDQESIDFTLRVVAIDLAGNESAPQTVRIADDPGHACAVARGGASRPRHAWIAALAFLVAARRRRREPVS